MPWVDSHCHLQGLDDTRAVIDRAVAAGVARMICVGTDLASSRQAVELAGRHPEVWATVGLHPHDATRFDEEWDAIAELATADRVVGVGEAGFDFHYLHSPADAQERAFRAHVSLAQNSGRTLVIHTREAWDATFGVLDEEGVPERTVFHCFTGGEGEAAEALSRGAYLSFSGIVSFGGAGEVQAAAAATPLDRVLVETDAPYLTPVPHRGRPNEPAYVVHVGEAVAGARGSPVGDVADATWASTAAVFGLPPGPSGQASGLAGAPFPGLAGARPLSGKQAPGSLPGVS
ncbi:MAG: TatD family hydrolase [Actinobacteria bacterium]|nr:TatD family hydrolase [Actinomycetota bacterium]